jgi:hypothetical protein
VNWNNNSWLQAIHQVSVLYLQRWQKKVRKTKKNLKILLSSRGITLANMNQSIWNTNWNSNSLLQSNTPSFNPIPAKIANKSPENWKNLKFC